MQTRKLSPAQGLSVSRAHAIHIPNAADLKKVAGMLPQMTQTDGTFKKFYKRSAVMRRLCLGTLANPPEHLINHQFSRLAIEVLYKVAIYLSTYIRMVFNPRFGNWITGFQ